jgi:hypothetical protein
LKSGKRRTTQQRDDLETSQPDHEPHEPHEQRTIANPTHDQQTNQTPTARTAGKAARFAIESESPAGPPWYPHLEMAAEPKKPAAEEPRQAKTRPGPPPPPLEIITDEKGRQRVVNPSPLSDMRKDQRRRVIQGVLEHAALHGSVDAAKAVLAHERWTQEMGKGRPPVRGKIELEKTILLVDDIGTTHQPVRRLPEETKVLEPGQHRPRNPAVPPTSDKDELCKAEETH